MGRPERRRPLGRPRCRWEDNIPVDLQEMVGGGWAWTGLMWLKDRDVWWAVVNDVMKIQIM